MPQYPAYFQLLSSTRLFTLGKMRRWSSKLYKKSGVYKPKFLLITILKYYETKLKAHAEMFKI